MTLKPALRMTWQRNGVRYSLIAAASLTALILYLLTSGSANTALFARNYPVLLGLTAALILGLLALVGYQLLRLRRRLTAGVFGARLTLRLVWLFALVAVLPGLLVYGVSVQFVGKSIESWFDVRVESALEGGLNLGHRALDKQINELTAHANVAVQALAPKPAFQRAAALETWRAQLNVQQLVLFDADGQRVANAGIDDNVIPVPAPQELQQILQQTRGTVEAGINQKLYLRVFVPVGEQTLQVLQAVPSDLAREAQAVQDGQRDYQELLLARRGLHWLYGLALTLTLLLALLTALSLAFALSEHLSAPLSYLAEGTRAVAQGDFRQREFTASEDELGMLTQSFNAMRQQLAEARSVAEHNQAQLAHAHAYLQSVLANLSAGVLAFDETLRLRSFNRSAGEMLDANFSKLIGSTFEQWRGLAPQLAALAQEILAALQNAGITEWERQVERVGHNGARAVLMHGVRLPVDGGGIGLIIVFDDITHVLQAQRDAAWSEVARRLAHEIKNPLTPIQLSAERLQTKLVDKLDDVAADLLMRSTQTIVNQVGALKKMVDAFRQYARLPELALQQIDFSALLHEVLTLYEPLGIRFEAGVEPDLPHISGDSAQLRQVMHNLLQNAQDALAGVAHPRIVVRAEGVGGMLRVTVTDNGSGFPEALMLRAFEPYATTKPKGTGLGLVIVKKIVEEHGGTVQIANITPHGARVTLTLPFAMPARVEKKIINA